MDLFSPVTALRGIGASRAKALEKLQIHTLYDLLSYFPRTYEDRTHILTIRELEPGVPACFEAMVVSEPRTNHIRKGLDITRLQVADETGQLTVVFFNQPYAKDQLTYGETYFFYGSVTEDFGRQIANPDFEKPDRSGTVTNRILPVYPLTAGISNRLLLSCIRQALDACADELPELLPDAVRTQYDLPGVREAYCSIHAPEDEQRLLAARRRLVFEEFFIFSAGLAVLRKRRVGAAGCVCKADPAPFLAALPFRLTDGQQHAVDGILRDLASGCAMNRLVQGDVGSGKTAVAAAAAYCVTASGHQAAFMAPTEILAEQHLATLSALLSPLGVRTALLTGSVTGSRRKAVLQSIADGQADLVIGTHALISDTVKFADLQLVIADEQHRFGVAQRAALSAKGENPHLLVMSATPIPRTLALIAYGDLDISVIRELPPGRLPIKTFLVGEDKRQRMNGFLRAECAAGHQVYIICPAVEEGEEESLKSAEVWAQTLQSAVFPELRVGLLHGRMKGAEKDAVLGAFSRGELDILVATTVVEVGVDVPNATVMVVENAERFGLSQLHQLRGRVGRGTAQSYCILFSSTRSPETRQRLKALCATNDGFQIAEEDLKLRGPGDFFGSRQHGLPLFKVASLQMDMETLQSAQEASADYITSADSLEQPGMENLKKRVEVLFSQTELALN